jgi:hypothetical protein
METMILVAGLAVAGLVGIAAAFYFSIRASRGGSKRNVRGGRAAEPDRAGADRRPGSRRSGAANAGRASNGRRPADNGPAANPGWAANDDWLANSGRAANATSRNYRADDRTGPNAALEFGGTGDHGLLSGRLPAPAGRRARTDTASAPTLAAPVFGAGNPDATPGEAWPGRNGAGAYEGDPYDDGRYEDGPAEDDDASDGRPAGGRVAARTSRGVNGPAGPKAAKSRRRVGFRKGADMDEEMWPAESFGGVSDDQFWDDLASDKPLTTTARSAQHESSARNRPLGTARSADGPAAVQPDGARGRGDAQRRGAAAGRGDGRARGRRAWNSSADQEPDAYPESAAGDGTAVMPAQSATQPVPPVPPVTQPVQAAPQSATQPVPSMTSPARGQSAQASPFHAPPVHAASMWAGEMTPAASAPPRTAPSRPAGPPPRGASPLPGHGGQPSRHAGPPSRNGTQPTETHGRRHAASASGPGADDDPLTSAAFSLRSSGPVDGNSQQGPRRSQDFSREQHDAVLSQETRAFRTDGYRSGAGHSGPSPTVDPYPASPGYGGTPPSPYAARPYSDLPREAPGTQSANTPPGGQRYGYPASPAAPADDPRQPNGARSHARHGGAPAPGDRPARPAYPPRNGNGYQPGGVNQGAPYDPREEYRRLTRQRKIASTPLSRADWLYARGRRGLADRQAPAPGARRTEADPQ